jgi:ribonuclease-3
MDILEKLQLDYKIYEEAFTHTSYANEQNKASYERLEFLGDAVLELIISNYLFLNFNDKEGMMTKERARLVREDALYEYALKLGLDKYVLVGHGEDKKIKKAILADVFEAFLGKYYLEKGFTKATEYILKYVIPLTKEMTEIKDYKSLLQELVQTEKREIFYDVLKEEGPAHDKQFLIAVKIDNIIYGKGSGHSKKEAEQKAAKSALDKCSK